MTDYLYVIDPDDTKGEPAPVRYVSITDDDICMHSETICLHCIAEWMSDWMVYSRFPNGEWFSLDIMVMSHMPPMDEDERSR